MEAPISSNELATLVGGMLHRERFVFEPTSTKIVEVYNAILEQNNERNITITVLLNGEKVQTKSKLYKKWQVDDYERLYKAITQH